MADDDRKNEVQRTPSPEQTECECKRDSENNESDHGKRQISRRHDTKQTSRTKSSKLSRHSTVSGEDGRSRQHDFFREELRRLESSLKRESSKIVAPSRRKYSPFIFNTLEPYYNTYTPRFLLELPEHRMHTYSNRQTAFSLTDPWISLAMDQSMTSFESPRPTTSHETTSLKPTTGHESDRSDFNKSKTRKSSSPLRGKSADENKPVRNQGSTRLPKFFIITLETRDLATKQLYFSDVPMLRKELKTKYSANARQKIQADYARTKQDFYRMDLDRMHQVAPGSRPHLTSAYLAYLQNTPGSSRAVKECVRTLQES